MPNPVSAEVIPQSWVDVGAHALMDEYVVGHYSNAEWEQYRRESRKFLARILAHTEDEGYRLVRDDEATVERAAEAIAAEFGDRPEEWYETARAALTAARGGEDG